MIIDLEKEGLCLWKHRYVIIVAYNPDPCGGRVRQILREKQDHKLLMVSGWRMPAKAWRETVAEKENCRELVRKEKAGGEMGKGISKTSLNPWPVTLCPDSIKISFNFKKMNPLFCYFCFETQMKEFLIFTHHFYPSIENPCNQNFYASKSTKKIL